LLRAVAKQCVYRHTSWILNPKCGGLLGSLGPADRSRRGRSGRDGRRCCCRQKDKIPHTTEYFPSVRSDRRRSSASCLYPADCVSHPFRFTSEYSRSRLHTSHRSPRSSDNRASFQATLVATTSRSGACFQTIAGQKTSQADQESRPYGIRGSRFSSANFHLCRRALGQWVGSVGVFLLSHAGSPERGQRSALFLAGCSCNSRHFETRVLSAGFWSVHRFSIQVVFCQWPRSSVNNGAPLRSYG
jgi:hypothetical protein